MTVTMPLVSGRECGECSVCCEALTINSRELKKPADTMCVHCIHPRGCGIYASRPSVCREWYCGWRKFEFLNDSWRPDRSGILIELVQDGLPWNYKHRTGVKFSILGQMQTVLSEPFVRCVADLIESGAPVFLSAGKQGHAFRRVLLNDRVMGAALSRDMDRIRMELTLALKTCIEHEGEKIGLGK